MEITISKEEYKILLAAKLKLDAICEIASRDDKTYSYSSATSEAIDTILGIDRDEK